MGDEVIEKMNMNPKEGFDVGKTFLEKGRGVASRVGVFQMYRFHLHAVEPICIGQNLNGHGHHGRQLQKHVEARVPLREEANRRQAAPVSTLNKETLTAEFLYQCSLELRN